MKPPTAEESRLRTVPTLRKSSAAISRESGQPQGPGLLVGERARAGPLLPAHPVVDDGFRPRPRPRSASDHLDAQFGRSRVFLPAPPARCGSRVGRRRPGHAGSSPDGGRPAGRGRGGASAGSGRHGEGPRASSEVRGPSCDSVSHQVQGPSRNYLMILVTWPAPTVRPPSRMANFRPSSMATGWISATSMRVLSPGMTISVPSGRVTTPVTSVVRK